jgi:polyisoprenoid-binding protein YceI
MRLLLTVAALTVAAENLPAERPVAAVKQAPASNIARYRIAPSESPVSFEIRHGIRQFMGHFLDFGGEIGIDRVALERSTATFRVRASSINTEDKERDEHLRSVDFFDVARFPKIIFRRTSMKRVADDRYAVIGDFTLRGVTQQITLDVTTSRLAPRPSEALQFSVTTKINRRDYGMVWNRVLDRHGVLLGDEVGINISLVARAAGHAPYPENERWLWRQVDVRTVRLRAVGFLN